MSETLIVGVLFVLLLAAVTFYFHSRMLYSERKISLLENVLLDIKINMEMVSEHGNDHLPGAVPSSNKAAAPTEKDEMAFYNSILEEVKTDALRPILPDGPTGIEGSQVLFKDTVTAAGPTAADAPPASTQVNYDDMSREDLVLLVEKRGLRATKRMSKQNIAALLRESDKNTYGASQSGNEVNGPAGTSNGIPSVEGSSLGAPLDMDQVEEVTL
jgi:hypothetical protein